MFGSRRTGKESVTFTLLLVWICGWDIILEKLGSGSESTRRKFENVVKNYASKIMTTNILFWQDCSRISSPCGLNCPKRANGINGMTKCDLQSIRNLRRKDGVTDVGDKAILFCEDCKAGHTSEDIAIALLCRVLGRQKVLNDGKMPTYKEGLWEKSGFVSKAFVHAEMFAIEGNYTSI